MDTLDKLQSLVKKDAKETRAWIRERNQGRRERQASRKIALHMHRRMEELNLNPDELAEKMKVKRAEVDKWLSGRYDFNMGITMQLSQVLSEDLITIKPL